MAGDLAAAMLDADPAAGDHHPHALADQPPRHTVGVGVDLDAAVGLDLPDQVADLAERRAAVERPQGCGFRPLEPLERRLPGRAVPAYIGDLAHPPGQVRLQRRPALEVAPGNGVALDVADAALVLALGARPVRGARPRLEAPVLRERPQPRVEPDLPRLGVVVVDQRPRVVQQHFLRQPGEVRERPLHPIEPRRLAVVPERLHVAAPRVAQRRHEQVHPHRLATDLHTPLAEVDLQLPAGRRLEPNRRTRLGLQRPAQRRHRTLDRPQAHRHPVLALQILAHHVGVPPMLPETLRQPRLQTGQLPATRRPPVP